MRRNQISIIVPVLNERQTVDVFLNHVKKLQSSCQVIFVDGGSRDGTPEYLIEEGWSCIQTEKGRAKQMNAGANSSIGDWLMFLHCDVSWSFDLLSVLNELIKNEILLANFRLRFDWKHWFLESNAHFSKYKALPFQFGDQGLWIQRALFFQIGGFDESFSLLEDNDIIQRARKYSPLHKINLSLMTSARKYRKHGLFNLQFKYYQVYLMYRLGYSQNQLQKCLDKVND